MSNEKPSTSVSASSNKDKALDRIAAVVGRYKIIKMSVLLQDVIKHVFGDQAEKDEAKANKRFSLIANLLNELVESGDLGQYSFVKVSYVDGGEPSAIQESIIVEGGFSLAGYVPAASVEKENEDVASEDDDVFQADEDDIANVLMEKASGYAVLNYKEGNSNREIYLKQTPNEALGKYMSLVGDEGNSPDVFALIPVAIEIKSMLGVPVEIKELSVDEPETAIG